MLGSWLSRFGLSSQRVCATNRYHPEDLELLTALDRDWADLGLADFRSYDLDVTHRDMLRHEPTLNTIENSLAELDAAAGWSGPAQPPTLRAAAAEGPIGSPLELGRGADLPEGPLVPVHELVAAQMRDHPDAPAVSCGDATFTYRQLDDWAHHIATELSSAGVGRGSRVGVLAERSVAMVAAVIAIMRLGAAYVPVDSAHPDRRVDAVLSDAEVTALVVTGSTKERAVASGVPRVCADECAGTAGQAQVSVTLDDTAYLIYTSGSTGEPKGVVVGHRELAASTAARRAVYPGRHRFLLVSPLAFDSSVAGVWGTLTTGGHLVVATSEEVRDPGLLVRLVDRHQVTQMLCVPSLYSVVLDAAEALGLATVRSLSTVVVAGEACPQELVDRHFQLRGESSVMYNEYGPTEATVWASCARFDAPAGVTIGRPVPGTRLYVLDERRRPVPSGVAGELYIGGAGVSRGYHGRPDATAERFLDDPFTDEPGARMYRTGDSARWNEHGTLDFIGRLDDQVKIRGHRIELGAVEAQLTTVPGVREAVVLPNATSTGLVGFALTSESLDSAALRTELAEALQSPMVPEKIVVLSEFPRTVNGKVDRALLEKRLLGL